MQPKREFPPNKKQEKPRKSKEVQGKSLAFPWIPLAEMGLFNGLQRIQIKKSPAGEFGCAKLYRTPSTFHDLGHSA
jgi:hypothetical protein